MTPWWKIKRELKVVANQLTSLPTMLLEPFVQRQYDRSLWKKISIRQGDIEFHGKIAIFLVFQPTGFPESIYLTIEHLNHSGFNVVLVSNAEIKPSDFERVRLLTSVVMVRPNFGYDFGGYRDALWMLRDHHIRAEQVLFLNDSIWFPVHQNSKMLLDMAASPAQYVGTQAFGTELSDGTFSGFFGSYCFLIKETLLMDKAFIDFWNAYRMTSIKWRVVRKGERSFSRTMLDTGMSSDAMYSHQKFASIVQSLTDHEAANALQDLIVIDDPFVTRKRDLMRAIDDGGDSVADAKKFIIEVAKKKNFIGSSPLLSLNKLQFPMIKKNHEMLYRLARRKILEASESHLIEPLHPVIAAELKSKIAKDSLS